MFAHSRKSDWDEWFGGWQGGMQTHRYTYGVERVDEASERS